NGTDQVRSEDLGHHQVQQNRFWTSSLEHLNHSIQVWGGQHLVAARLENFAGAMENALLIVHHQHAGTRGAHVGPPSPAVTSITERVRNRGSSAIGFR